jgi:hypothetical protein
MRLCSIPVKPAWTPDFQRQPPSPVKLPVLGLVRWQCSVMEPADRGVKVTTAAVLSRSVALPAVTLHRPLSPPSPWQSPPADAARPGFPAATRPC